jgi:hypothetical protein
MDTNFSPLLYIALSIRNGYVGMSVLVYSNCQLLLPAGNL